MKSNKEHTTSNKSMIIAAAVVAVLGVGYFAATQASDDSNDTVSAQSQSGSEAATKTITELAVESASLSTLEAAVLQAELADTLSGDGPFTVFAPNDDAFTALLGELNVTAEELLARDDLASILTYHVVPSKALAADLKDGQKLTTVQGEELLVSIDGDSVKINGVNVITPNVEATNGVVHILDGVLLPGGEQMTAAEMAANGTVVDIAVANGFDTLVAAVTKAGLAETLSGDGEFTVFAPTNAAFEELLSALDVSADDLLAREDLADILLYHVIPGSVLASDVVAASGSNVETLLEGREWHVLADDEGVFILNPETAEKIAEVTATDIKGTNGVVHVIDAVLVP